MSITLSTTDGELAMSVEYGDEVDRYSALIDLPAWKAYRVKGEGPGRRGKNVELVCEPTWDEDRPSLGDSDAYSFCLKWMLAHQRELHDAVIFAATNYVAGELRDYIGDDPEIAAFSQPKQLRGMIDLVSVRLYSSQKAGLPYVGFEFDCSWDCEHGFGVVLFGLSPIAVGGTDVFQENCPVDSHRVEISRDQ